MARSPGFSLQRSSPQAKFSFGSPYKGTSINKLNYYKDLMEDQLDLKILINHINEFLVNH